MERGGSESTDARDVLEHSATSEGEVGGSFQLTGVPAGVSADVGASTTDNEPEPTDTADDTVDDVALGDADTSSEDVLVIVVDEDDETADGDGGLGEYRFDRSKHVTDMVKRSRAEAREVAKNEATMLEKQTKRFFSRTGQVTNRETEWMREMVAKSASSRRSGQMAVPYASQPTHDCTGRRLRPTKADFLLRDRSAYFVDFEEGDPARRICAEHGLLSTPCGNPNCFGRGDNWHTMPLPWSKNSAAPKVLVGARGVVEPVVSRRSKCVDCGLAFDHLNRTTLSRVPTESFRGLDVDPDWTDGDVILRRTLTSALEYDMNARQGAENFVKKLRVVAGERFAELQKEYFDAGQVWFKQLTGLAGDDVWAKLSEEEQCLRVNLRAEFLSVPQTDDKLEALGSSFLDRGGFGAPEVGSETVLKRLATALELRHEERRRELVTVGEDSWVSIDWSKRQGERAGGVWLCLLTNSDGLLLGSLVTATTKLEEIQDMLRKIGERPNFTAKVVVLDNVPENVDTSQYAQLLKETLGVADVMQDRFHVMHNLSQHFNNTHSLYNILVIHGVRAAATVFDSKRESELDAKLRAGGVEKHVDFRGQKITICRGDRIIDTQIAGWKASGAYDHMFGKVVPRVMKSKAALEIDFAALCTKILAMVTDEDGDVRCDGKVLITDAATEVPKLLTSLLKRMKNCVPPLGMPEFRETSQIDSCTGMTVVKMNFHTGHNENANGQVLDHITADNMEPGLATGLYAEGHAKLNATKVRAAQRSEAKKRGRESAGEDPGHFKPWLCRAVNNAAGFGDTTETDPSLARLVLKKPYDMETPKPAASGEIIINDVGRYDQRNKRRALVSAEVTTRLITAREGAETLRPTLPEEVKLKMFAGASTTVPPPRPSTSAVGPPVLSTAAAPSPTSSIYSASANGDAGIVPRPRSSTSAGDPTVLSAAAARPLTTATVAPRSTASSTSLIYSASANGGAGTVPRPRSSTSAVGPTVLSTAAARPLTTATGVVAGPGVATPNPLLSLASAGTGVIAGREKSTSNKWLCTCLPTYGQSRGRPHHKPECPRERWAKDRRLPKDPPYGAILSMLECARPRTGRFQWNNNNWIEIDDNDNPKDGKPLGDPRRAERKRKRKSPATASTRNAPIGRNNRGQPVCLCDEPARTYKTHAGQEFYGCPNFPRGRGCGYMHFLPRGTD